MMHSARLTTVHTSAVNHQMSVLVGTLYSEVLK